MTTTLMSPEAHKHAEWALLNELAEQLEWAHEEAEQLRDHPTWRWPDADLTMNLGFINATVEALDALSGQDEEDLAKQDKGGEDR